MEGDRKYACCFSGHRLNKLPWKYQETGKTFINIKLSALNINYCKACKVLTLCAFWLYSVFLKRYLLKITCFYSDKYVKEKDNYAHYRYTKQIRNITAILP